MELASISFKSLHLILLQDQDNNDLMAYWLSNTSTLLFMLQRSLKATGAVPRKPPTPTSLFGRMTQVTNLTVAFCFHNLYFVIIGNFSEHIDVYFLCKDVCNMTIVSQGFRSSSANLSVGPIDVVR